MKKYAIAFLILLIALINSVTLFASDFYVETAICQADTNSARRTIKCPKCGESFTFGQLFRHYSNTDMDMEAKIASFVDDLDDDQREQLHELSVRSKQVIGQLRQQQREIHDSIRQLLRQPTDQSDVLFPLFDKSAQVRAEIDKELYIARFNISKVLTEKQLETLSEKMKLEKKNFTGKNTKTRKKHSRKKKQKQQ